MTVFCGHSNRLILRLNDAWSCGMPGPVICLVLWYAWSCGMPGPVVCLVLWYAWSCGMPGPVVCLVMWYAWSCDMPGPVVCLDLWYAWSCGMPGPVSAVVFVGAQKRGREYWRKTAEQISNRGSMNLKTHEQVYAAPESTQGHRFEAHL
ncbi:hypothetical protein BgiBS90_035346 [Biomphalaria glabrata]|nr:hypothetical protein BgiBS90_035346 [Biomphalaria glabrata]